MAGVHPALLFAPHGLDNPVKYTDPTGHTACVGANWDDGPNCLKNPDSTLSISVRIAKYHNDCAAGRNSACPGGAKGLVESAIGWMVAAFVNPVPTALSVLAMAIWGPPQSPLLAAMAPRPSNWVFGDNHSDTQWSNRMDSRGWTSAQIDEAIQNGEAVPAANNVNPGNTATRYIHPDTGRSVVVDDTTNEILHLGGDDFLYEIP